jgi:hypothetical protein
MARAQETILVNSPDVKGLQAPVANVGLSRAHGYALDQGSYANDAFYTRQQVLARVLKMPTIWDVVPGGDKLKRTFKSLIELNSRTIEGLDSSLEREFAEISIGGSNEVHEVLINVSRNRSEPTHVHDERMGYAINNFYDHWTTAYGMDPETKRANVANEDIELTDMLPDKNTATVLYMEPDATGRYVVNAWLSTNMQPKGTTERIGRRNPQEGNQTAEITMPYTAITAVGPGVLALAQKILEETTFTGANPGVKAFLDDVDPMIKSIYGYQQQVDDFRANQP